MVFSVHKKNNISGIRRVLLASTTVLVGVSAYSVAMAQGDETKVYAIPPSDVGNALQVYSEQADVEIIYAEGDVEGKTTDGVDGAYSREAALEEIINDADLTYEVNDDGVVVIRSSFLDIKQASARAPEVRYVQASLSATAQDAEAIALETERFDEESDEGFSDVVIVTGTNIRGIAPESSPVRSFDREDIQMTGAATAQDFIQTLPSNFGGGSNAGTTTGLPNNIDAGFNIGFGSSVNLRGLGSGSTLVLMNGHRLAPSSGLGDFVDISMIPASALERVDVLSDGASSIYGADAVAGVVNFILRDDFDGAEASYRYGTVTEGGLSEHRASATAGKSWDTGNALVVYEFFRQGNLGVEDRAFSSTAAVPQDLLASQRRHSVLASVSQKLTPDIEFFADVNFSSRDGLQGFISTGDSFRREATTKSINASAGLIWQLSDSWDIDIVGTYSDLDQSSESFGSVTLVNEIDSSMSSVDVRASGALFPLPGGEVKLAFGGHYRSEMFTNFNVTSDTIAREAERDVYAAFGEAFIPIVGSDNALPGIERLELNVSGRFSDFSNFGSTANPKVGLLWSPVDALRFRGSYSTSFNPPPLGRVGATDLQALAYPTALINALFGFTPADPSIANVIGLAVSGTADNLDAEQSRAFTGGIEFNQEWGRHNLDVSATYFDIKFEDRLGRTPTPDNRSNFEVPSIAITSPDVFPPGTIIFNPSSEQIDQTLASTDRPVIRFAGADPQDAAFIIFAGVTRNLSLTYVRGIDFDIGYTYDSSSGVFQLGLDGTFLDDFQQQAAVTTPIVEQLNTEFNPVDLRVRARAGYANEGLAANIFVNYTNSYRVNNTPGAAPINSWTTVDLSLSYDTREAIDRTVLRNTIIRLSVRNLFDQDPPSTPIVPTISEFGYDPANASPINRFIAFELIKQF